MPIDRRTVIEMAAKATAGLAIGAFGAPRQTAARQAAPPTDGCSGATVKDFARRCFVDARGTQRVFYETSATGPSVLVLHELPGLVEDDLEAARRLAAQGFHAVMPLFFGVAGEKSSLFKTLRYRRRHCNEREFACNDAERTSPHVDWLCDLAALLWRERPVGHGVGVVGMCLTGAMPIAMLRHPIVKAAVACQPTVPFNSFTPLGLLTKKSGLGISPDDLAAARRSSAPILGIRYASDPLCTNARFRRLTAEFGSRFYRMDLTGAGHSTLGHHLCGLAAQEAAAFLDSTLSATPSTTLPRFPFASRPNARDEIWVSCRHHA
jgi:dienelactone hydrolase